MAVASSTILGARSALSPRTSRSEPITSYSRPMGTTSPPAAATGALRGRRDGHGGQRGRPPRRQPLAEAADGTMGERARGGGAREAEPRVQLQLAAVETEQPDRGGIGRNLHLRVGRETTHDELEIEDIG